MRVTCVVTAPAAVIVPAARPCRVRRKAPERAVSVMSTMSGKRRSAKQNANLSNCDQAANIALKQCLNNLSNISDDEVNQCILYADELRNRCEVGHKART